MDKRKTQSGNIHLTLVVLIIIAIIGILGYIYLSNTAKAATELSQFDQQSTSMKNILEKLQTASGSSDRWNYSEFCDRWYGESSSWPNRCFSIIYSFMPVAADTNVRAIDEKYFPIISDNSGIGFSGSKPGIKSKDYNTGRVTMSGTSDEGFFCKYVDSYSLYKPGDKLGAQIITDNPTDTILVTLNCTKDTYQTTYPISPYSPDSINSSTDLYVIVNRL